jgi:hypothetical protein
MSIVLDGSVGISSIGTLTGVTSISSTTADTPVILQDSSSNSNTCRAWVNFNGTGTVAIRADFNVSSITDNGTGNYTMNFNVAMPDTDYAVTHSGAMFRLAQTGTLTASAYQFVTQDTTPSSQDYDRVMIGLFR